MQLKFFELMLFFRKINIEGRKGNGTLRMKLFQTGAQWSLDELKGEGRNALRSAPHASICASTAAVATSIAKTMDRAP
jgi:hypothetical protein